MVVGKAMMENATYIDLTDIQDLAVTNEALAQEVFHSGPKDIIRLEDN